MKNKKLLGLLGVAALLLAGNFAMKEVNEVDAANETNAVTALFTKYYNKGIYTKKTEINVKNSTKNEIKALFHGSVSSLKRTTYYEGGELWMTNDEGTINSGYGTSGKNMTHFTKNSSGTNSVDYTVEGVTMEEHYVTLHDFVGGTHKSSHTNNKTLDLTADWVKKGNGYSSTNPDVLDAFRLFTAPLWVGKTAENENYLSFTEATVEESGTNLIMSLYVSTTEYSANDSEGKITNSNGLFSQAIISRGIWQANIGTDKYSLDLNDNALNEYMLQGVNVKKDSTVEIYKYGIVKQKVNSYTGNFKDSKFRFDKNACDLYVKMSNGSISEIYASGSVKYTITMQWNGFSDNAKIFAWSWGTGMSDQWVPAEKDPSNANALVLYFSDSVELAGCIPMRMSNSATTGAWSGYWNRGSAKNNSEANITSFNGSKEAGFTATGYWLG